MKIDSPVFPWKAGLLYMNMNRDVSGHQSGMEVCIINAANINPWQKDRSMFDANTWHGVIRFAVCLFSNVMHIQYKHTL